MNTAASDTIPLRVDLDGTLTRTDLLLESALALLKQNPLYLFVLPFWLMRGRAYLKQRIARRARIDIPTLPWDPRVADPLEAARQHRALILRAAVMTQEFITPHCPQQNGMVERLIRTLKEQCAHRHRFETLQHAMRVIGDWIGFYNHQRPHQALGMKTPAEAYALAA